MLDRDQQPWFFNCVRNQCLPSLHWYYMVCGVFFSVQPDNINTLYINIDFKILQDSAEIT